MKGLVLASLLLLPSVHAAFNATIACQQIQKVISSSSEVFWPGKYRSLRYTKDVNHWASSSSDVSACSVEPGTADDLGRVLQVIGSTRTPFAVKGGGHATNPGFSSTPGVHIAMYRFSEVNYVPLTQTVEVGAGLIWDDVYAALEPHDVNVVGGRVSGVGVAGFSLGGGYSWLSNQYGLTVDNIVAMELVLPDGKVTFVDASNSDLLWALKGGAYNNLGIVTRFIMKAYPQGQVWGGLMVIDGLHLDAVTEATAKFSSDVTDPKAQIIPTYDFLTSPIVSLLMFYDAPTPPSGIFDDFLAIPSLDKDVKTRSFLSLVQSSPSNTTSGLRAVFHTVSLLENSAAVLKAVANETIFWGNKLALASASFISYDVEPFLPGVFANGKTALASYPPTRARTLMPLNIYWAWSLPTSDELIRSSIVQSAAHLTQVAISEGQDIGDAPLYSNYAIDTTPKERIFGANLPKLQALKALYDPQNVMDLAGGWKYS
ncbi:FAD-binding domain-containing protein [Trametopsis cervina]|nr:FAD-binding domain-containing protein [Trametopsis cervina]